MKKLICVLLALTLVFALAACSQTQAPAETPTEAPSQTEAAPEATEAPAPGEVKMTDGVYWIGGDADETGIPFTWIKLYEDGTYYEKDFAGTFLSAGTYALLDEPTEYLVDSDGDKMAIEGEDPSATSEQTIVFTDYQTGEQRRVAYVDDALVNMTVGNGMSRNRTLLHDAAYPFNESTDVIAIQLFVLYANNDPGANFIVNHNRTFEDVTGDYFDEGTWEMTAPGEYNLTYADGSAATLAIADGGKSATLTKADGTVVELKDSYKEEENLGVAKQMELRNEEVAVPELPMAVALRLDAWSDGTCQLIVEVAAVGAELVADTGTFEVDPAMNVTFHFEKAGDLAGTPEYAGATETTIPITVQYSAAVEPEFNGAATPMTLDAELTGIYDPSAVGEAVETVATFTAEGQEVGLPITADLTIECYSDGTAKLLVYVAAVDATMEADTGTYEVDAAANMIFHFETAGDVAGVPDYSTATESSVEMDIQYTGDVTVTFDGNDTPLSLDSTLHGTYSIA